MDELQWLHLAIGREGQDITWWQMSLRAAVIFLCGLVLVRLAGRRVFGKWGALDILLAVIIGSNLSRAITGSAPFLPTLCATLVLVLLHSVQVYAAVWAPRVGELVKGRPTLLVRDGLVDHGALRRHGIGSGDLDQALRCGGVSRVEEVAAAHLERNGTISVLKRVIRSDPRDPTPRAAL